MYVQQSGSELNVKGWSVVVPKKKKKNLNLDFRFIEMRGATRKIQESYRAWKSRISFLQRRRAAVVIQVLGNNLQIEKF